MEVGGHSSYLHPFSIVKIEDSRLLQNEFSFVLQIKITPYFQKDLIKYVLILQRFTNQKNLK